MKMITADNMITRTIAKQLRVTLTLSQMNVNGADDSRALQFAFVPCIVCVHVCHGDRKLTHEQGVVGQFSSLLPDVIWRNG